MLVTLDLFGVLVFALSGALAADRLRMDVFGFIVIALLPFSGARECDPVRLVAAQARDGVNADAGPAARDRDPGRRKHEGRAKNR